LGKASRVRGYTQALAIDAGGNAIVTGGLNNGDVDFGGKMVSVAGPSDGDFFVAKYNASGEVQWVQVAYGGYGIAADKHDNLYFGGYVAGESLPPAMHCGKFDPNGAVIWEKTILGASGTSLALDANDNPIFSGSIYGTADFDGITVQGHGAIWSDILLCKMDTEGKTQWAISGGGPYQEWGSFVVSDSKGSIYLGGPFAESSAFTFGSAQIGPLYPPGPDIFLARVTESPFLSIDRAGQNVLLSWPASASGYSLEMTDALRNPSWSPVSTTASSNGSPMTVAGDEPVETDLGALSWCQTD
jgi:hypothetical protein